MAGLDLYRAKRDFSRTGEPEGAPQSQSGKAKARKAHGGAFVVHKHAARRLHYDLRLEHDGVLWSWAIAILAASPSIRAMSRAGPAVQRTSR